MEISHKHCTACSNIEELLFSLCRTDKFCKEVCDRWEIKSLVRRQTDKSVKNLIDNFTSYHLPGIVGSEVALQFPSYLDNNFQLQQVLQKHAEQQNKKLLKTAENTLLELADEPKYHKVSF